MPGQGPAPPDAAGLPAGATAALALLWMLLCAPRDAGCRFLTVVYLLDRVIQHRARIHSALRGAGECRAGPAAANRSATALGAAAGGAGCSVFL